MRQTAPRRWSPWALPAQIVVQIAILVAGLALRLAFIHAAPRIAGDTLIYGEIARNWMERGIYAFSLNGQAPHLTLIRLPGYPLFLMACFRVFGMANYHAVMLVQAALDLLGCVLVAEVARRRLGRRAGLLALALGALCPFTADFVAAPLTETLSLFSIAATLFLLDRWIDSPGYSRWFWALALTLAYALLLRPEQALLTAAVVPVVVWRMLKRKRAQPEPGRSLAGALLPAAVLCLCVVLPLVPWTVRNWRTFHVVEPLAPRSATDPGEMAPSGFNRWFRSWGVDFASTEDVYWNYDGARIEMGDLPDRAFDSPSQRAETQLLLRDYDVDQDASPAIDARFAHLAGERAAAHPLRFYVLLPLARLGDMLLRPRTENLEIPLEWWRWREHPRASLFALGWAAINLGYLVLGVAGAVRWWRSGRDRPLLLTMAIFVLLRCATLLTLDNSETRYTLEFFPLLFLCGAALAGRQKQTP